MTAADPITVQRAAGAVLRGLKRRGIPPNRVTRAARSEPLRPAMAIDALLAAMRARFDLSAPAAEELLRPALADWRDAVGCADPLLVPANALGAAAEKHLLPLPLPSWCAPLVDAGVILLDGAPLVEGPRVVQLAWLSVIRETELAAVECFPVVFAGRHGSGAAALRIHLALSPPFLSPRWHGNVCVRAGAQRIDGSAAAVSVWLGAPATPGSVPSGMAGETAVTWVVPRVESAALADWPSGWPRWAVLRVCEGREPQALWEVPALWHACTGSAPEARVASPVLAAASTLRLAVDIGSTSTVLVEEDSAAAGALGAKLMPQGAPRPTPSGFRRLGGDAATAHLVGCGEHLLAPGGQLPTALVAPGAAAVTGLLRGSQNAGEQLWLPQAPVAEQAGGPLLIDRFKSPELLLLSDWLAQLPEAAADRAHVSRTLLETFAYQVGRTLASAHAVPLVTPEGGRWVVRQPQLASAQAVLTYPDCAFDSGATHSFSAVYEGAAAQLCRGLRAAWDHAAYRLVADPAAARAARAQAGDGRHPIEAYVDFGGLTLQITVRVPASPARPAPFIAGSSSSFLLGGERLIDAAAFAAADRDSPDSLREAYRDAARRWRGLIASGGRLRGPEADRHGAVAGAVLHTVLELVRRQLEGTLRRAAPDLSTLRGAGVRLHLLGEAWKLVAMDVEDELRERETLRRIEEQLQKIPLLHGAPLQFQRMTKRRVCEGALRVRAADTPAEPALELQGVDVASGDQLLQRWFGVADPGAPADPDVMPHREDAWWRSFASGVDSLLRVEQWFSAPPSTSPFHTGLLGGNVAFDARRPMLKQWIDACGPSLVALRIRQTP